MPKTVKFNHTPLNASLVLIAYRALLDERCCDRLVLLSRNEFMSAEDQALIIHLCKGVCFAFDAQIIIKINGDRLIFAVAETFGTGEQSEFQPFSTLDNAIEYAVAWFAEMEE